MTGSRPVLLSEGELANLATYLPDWQLQNASIERSFVFADFVAAFAFMAHVALLAEQQDHHPDWRNVWNRVDIRLNTHDAGGVTMRDVRLAQAIDLIPR